MQNSGAMVVIDIPQRRKRICRGLNLTSPPDFVLNQFSLGLTDCQTEWESAGTSNSNRNLNLAPWQESKVTALVSSLNFPASRKRIRTAEALLKKKRRRMYIQEPPFLTPDVEAIIPCVSSVLSSAFRCNANHVAVGRVQKDGSSGLHLQQTTRVPIGGPVVASAVQQMNNRIVAGLAAGMAARSCTDKVTIARPECTFHPSPKEAVEWVRECKDGSEKSDFGRCIVAIIQEVFLPRSLNPGHLLATMIEIARKELHEHLISAVVPQSTRHLEMVCTYICKAKDGSRVWFCLQLLVWMVSGDFRNAFNTRESRHNGLPSLRERTDSRNLRGEFGYEPRPTKCGSLKKTRGKHDFRWIAFSRRSGKDAGSVDRHGRVDEYGGYFGHQHVVG